MADTNERMTTQETEVFNKGQNSVLRQVYSLLGRGPVTHFNVHHAIHQLHTALAERKENEDE